MSKRKLLLADDSITVQKVVNLAFESEDIEIITANDGVTAFEKFVEFSPNLVMADINLSGADGYEICERIKQDESTKHIPVILLVGSFAPFSEEKAARVGASGFLKKPFQSINLLIDKVTELIGVNETDDSDSSEAGFHEADTKPMPAYEQSAGYDSMSDDFSKAGIDDEMIETERGTDYSFADETSKYETNAGFDIDSETEGSGITQPMTSNESEEFGSIGQNEETAAETVYELADEPDDYSSAQSYNFNEEIAEKTETQPDETIGKSPANPADFYEDYAAYQQTKTAETESFPTPEVASALQLDNFELLELPPLDTVDESFSTDYSVFNQSPAANTATDNPPEEETKTDYADYAETTAEDSYSIPQSARSLETQSSYYPLTEEPEADFNSEEIQTETLEESSVTSDAETVQFTENYSSPEIETTENSFDFKENEEISAANSDKESSAQDFAEEETQTEIASETRAMITRETQQEISQASDNKVVVHYLPPEVIDEIAERVVEKLAEKLRR